MAFVIFIIIKQINKLQKAAKPAALAAPTPANHVTFVRLACLDDLRFGVAAVGATHAMKPVAGSVGLSDPAGCHQR